VTAVPPIDAEGFVAAVKPLLEARDLEGLWTLLRHRWRSEQITALLNDRNHDARKVAALALSLVGGQCCVDDLARRLRDPDPMTGEMAEHALWSIWFRLGSEEANHHLGRGAQHIHRMEYEQAIEHFDQAVELSPQFAEAYNQRGIALYLLEQFEASIADCCRAVELMPCHFGAWSGMGHCLAHLGRYREAIAAYDRALVINPRLDCIREAVAELHKKLE
jgi:tetratricopeptide (TPR) repeat protein